MNHHFRSLQRRNIHICQPEKINYENPPLGEKGKKPEGDPCCVGRTECNVMCEQFKTCTVRSIHGTEMNQTLRVSEVYGRT